MRFRTLFLAVFSLALQGAVHAVCVYEQSVTAGMVPGGNTWIDRFTASASDTVTNVQIYISTSTGSNAYVGIYSEALLAPDTLLASSVLTPLSEGWNSIPLQSGVAVTAATPYWVGVAIDIIGPTLGTAFDAAPDFLMTGSFAPLTSSPMTSAGGTERMAVILGSCGTPTTSPTPGGPTQTSSPTHTPTPSQTRTATATSSESPTATVTATWTVTRTSTPTRSPSPTSSDTATSSATRSASPTLSSTSTSTPTVSPTSSVTPSATPTATRTSSPTATDTPTRTLTATPTGTRTSSPTASDTPTRTLTVTPTGTRTSSPTATETFSYSPTATHSPTATESSTPTPSRTTSPSSTATPSATPSATLTPTSTASPSSTASNTFTVSPTFTESQTITPTFTPVGRGTLPDCLAEDSFASGSGARGPKSSRAATVLTAVLAPNPVGPGAPLRVLFTREVKNAQALVFSLAGELVDQAGLSAQGILIKAPASPGIYFMHLEARGFDGQSIIETRKFAVVAP